MNILSRLFLYLFGTLTISISGEYCERMLNVMASHNISFWKPIKKKDVFYVTVMRKDIKKIRLLRRNIGVKVKIIKKRGFPLVYKKYKHRYGLILGVIIFIAAINFLSSRMWMIKVNGNYAVSDLEISSFFESCGVTIGVSMNSIDSDILKQQLILSFDNIAWASVNKQGSVIEVNITEFLPGSNENDPCNIVSQYDAIVKKVNVSKGSVNVKIGDTVSKNQILVSGIVNYGSGNSFVHSSGEIIAELRFKENVSIDKLKENSTDTGKVLSRKTAEIMGIKIPLYLGSVHGDFRVNNTYEYVEKFGGKIPIIIYEEEYVFVSRTYTSVSKDEARVTAEERLTQKLKEIGASEISIEPISVSETSDKYLFEYNVICLIDIGKEVPIVME